jgi:tocopherol O-methyltransferase
MSEAAAQHHDRLREYYEDTWFDYRFLWLDPRTRALHFGYEAEPWVHRWPWERGGHDDALLALNDLMADAAGISDGQRVVDAGCGVGGSSMWLAEQRHVSVVGVNVVADHVERARRYAAERVLTDRVSFEVADYTNTHLAAASFDVAWLVESACHAPSKPALTTEMARVVAPGGRLVMAEYVLQPEPHSTSDHVRVWNESWEMTLATEHEWREALAEAGWMDIEVLDVTSNMVRSLRRLRRMCRLLSPIAKVLKVARIRTAAQQRNIRGSIALWDALQAGDWRYCIITATRA